MLRNWATSQPAMRGAGGGTVLGPDVLAHPHVLLENGATEGGGIIHFNGVGSEPTVWFETTEQGTAGQVFRLSVVVANFVGVPDQTWIAQVFTGDNSFFTPTGDGVWELDIPLAFDAGGTNVRLIVRDVQCDIADANITLRRLIT